MTKDLENEIQEALDKCNEVMNDPQTKYMSDARVVVALDTFRKTTEGILERSRNESINKG